MTQNGGDGGKGLVSQGKLARIRRSMKVLYLPFNESLAFSGSLSLKVKEAKRER
jgi:hypothetical protein